MFALPHRSSDWVYLLGVLIFVGFAVAEFYRRHRAGPVLFDLGGPNRHGVTLAVGVLMFALGCVEIVFLPPGRFQGLFFICFGAMMLPAATGRAQIRQSGIFGRRLFRWEEIEEYYLGPKGGLELKVKGTGWTRTRVRVPSELWRQANDVLASRLPAQQVSAGWSKLAS